MPHEKIENAYSAVIDYVREKHAGEIDDAYDHFWEEEDPEEFLTGFTLELGFHNFEDWMVCAYRPRGDDAKSFVERFVEDTDPDVETRAMLNRLTGSTIALYEVVSAGDGTATLKDMLRGDEVTVRDGRFSQLAKGEMFGARLIDVDGELVPGRCIYPFGSRVRESVMYFIDQMYKRYCRFNDNASMESFLKDDACIMNIIWVTCLFHQKPDQKPE